MSLVVQSTTIASASNADNVVINKPSGVQTGDLLVIVASGYQSNLPTVSGFSSGASHTYTGSTTASIALLYRIADASDVSASNYTVALAGSSASSGLASMFRISGWTTGNPVLYFETGESEADPITASGASSLTLLRPQPQLLILGNLFQSTSGSLSSATFSGYTITSSHSNPTWTEVQDAQIAIEASAANVAMSVAYANSSDTSTITAYTTAVSSDANGNADSVISLLAVICEPSNATGTNALLASDPTFFANTAIVGGIGTNVLLEVSPDFESQSGNATTPTQWTNETKSSTSWANETL